MIVYLARDIPTFVMYYIYGACRSSLLIESTDSMIVYMFRLVVYRFALIYIYRSNISHVNTQLGFERHRWFNYTSSLLNLELEFTCLSG